MTLSEGERIDFAALDNFTRATGGERMEGDGTKRTPTFHVLLKDLLQVGIRISQGIHVFCD